MWIPEWIDPKCGEESDCSCDTCLRGDVSPKDMKEVMSIEDDRVMDILAKGLSAARNEKISTSFLSRNLYSQGSSYYELKREANVMLCILETIGKVVSRREEKENIEYVSWYFSQS